jgi:hypothetical protein
MRTRTLVAAAATLGCLAAALPAHAEVVGDEIENGDFEQPDVPTGSFRLYDSIPGWERTNGCAIEIQDHTPHGTPRTGDQFVELDSLCSGGIQQSFATEPGLRYYTGYWYSPRPANFSDAGAAYNNVMHVSWDGAVVQTQQRAGAPTQTDWSFHAFERVATGGTSTLAFEDGATHPAGVSDTLGPYVDGVFTLPHYDLCLLYDPDQAKKSGATVPVKLRICDSEGDNLSDPSIDVWAWKLAKVDGSEQADIEDAGNANPGDDFRYDAALVGYIFNLKTTGLSVGAWRLHFGVAGVTSNTYVADFVVK